MQKTEEGKEKLLSSPIVQTRPKTAAVNNAQPGNE
jgi:hypothetical protein